MRVLGRRRPREHRPAAARHGRSDGAQRFSASLAGSYRPPWGGFFLNRPGRRPGPRPPRGARRPGPQSWPFTRPSRPLDHSVRDGIRTVAASLAILGIAAAVQAAIFVLSGSVALLADLIHNVGDAL